MLQDSDCSMTWLALAPHSVASHGAHTHSIAGAL